MRWPIHRQPGTWVPERPRERDKEHMVPQAWDQQAPLNEHPIGRRWTQETGALTDTSLPTKLQHTRLAAHQATLHHTHQNTHVCVPILMHRHPCTTHTHSFHLLFTLPNLDHISQ